MQNSLANKGIKNNGIHRPLCRNPFSENKRFGKKPAENLSSFLPSLDKGRLLLLKYAKLALRL
jgi:hypothetical protein